MGSRAGVRVCGRVEMGVAWYGSPQRGWTGLGFASSSLCGVRGKRVKAGCKIVKWHRVHPLLSLVPSLSLSLSLEMRYNK